MGFKINVDRFGFAKEPKPEKNSRDYAAQLAKKLVDKEAIARTNEDEVLLGKITAEESARATAIEQLREETDRKLAAEVDERNIAISDAVTGEVVARNEAIESAIDQEERTRELKDKELEELIDEKVSVKADKGITLEAYGIVNAYTIPEVEAIKRDLKAEISNTEAEISKKANLINGSGGFAGGSSSSAYDTAVSIGYGAVAHKRGVSLGENAVSGADNGISIGNRAWTFSDGTFYNAIQLGTGINAEEHTFQVYDFKLLNADGTIPEERIPKLAVHEADIEALKQSGGGNVDLSGYYTKDDIDDMYGDINSVLDEIIALQVAKGGDAV